MAIPKGLNQEIAKQSMRGSKWGEEDQHRYDIATGAKLGQKGAREIRGDGEGIRTNYAQLQAKKDEGVEFSQRAQGQYDRMGDRIQKIDARQAAKSKAQAAQGSTGKPANAIDQTTTGAADSVYSNYETTQEQNVNQDNDINTSVNGNDNTVITEQDNSVRFYGGDNRNFVYNGGKGGATGGDAPVSAATMAGFYAPDDSPAAQAKRNSLHTTMNADNQKRYAGDAMKVYAKYGNIDARSYTDESMENAINRGTQYSFDRADRQTGHVFGDIWNDNYITEEWKMPSAPSPIESNAEEIAKKAKDDIEDI